MNSVSNNAAKKICIIGCGNMGGACLSGWLSSKEGLTADLTQDDFVCVIPNDLHRETVEQELGVQCLSSTGDLNSVSDIGMILLAVKPQVLPGVLEELSQSNVFQVDNDSADAENGQLRPLVLSIAAGISTKDIEAALPNGVRVVRAMPNMPLQVGHGATAICAGSKANSEDVEYVNQLFSTLGMSNVTDESLIDAVCAISGGGPAYVAYMIEALRDAGVSLGLDASFAESLALETVGGTYDTMIEKELSPEKMRKSVCSPGGTTLAALAEFDVGDFKPMIEKAMASAVDRAAELREGE